MKQSFYDKQVLRAKRLVQKRNVLKWEIAKIAYETCEIVVGGKRKEDTYSLTKFANDIGMNRKTLSDWVHNYKIKLVLEETKEVETVTETICNELRKKLRASEGGLRESISKERVAKTLQEIRSENHELVKLQLLKKQLINLEFAICHSYKLDEIEPTILAEIEVHIEKIRHSLIAHFKKINRPKVKLVKKSSPVSRARTEKRLHIARLG